MPFLLVPGNIRSIRRRMLRYSLRHQDDFIKNIFVDLFSRSKQLRIRDSDKIVIMSDMHVGNRGRSDDFLKNGSLCGSILEDYYFEKDYTLLLNGDIEELHRFTLKEIEQAWPRIYEIFQAFADRDRLWKNIGNHDIILPLQRNYRFREQLSDSLRLEFGENTLFVFHGHQVSPFQRRFNMLAGLLLRVIVKPLGIKSYSVSADKKKQFRVERRIYRFSEQFRIASVIGHTHRPLFESLSKSDSLRFQIEQLCREYASVDELQIDSVESRIRALKRKLDWEIDRHGTVQARLSIYNAKVVVPSLFNSGCAIGKSGITAIEITNENIALVHWTDRVRGERHFSDPDDEMERLGNTDYYRTVLHREKLRYIFGRIRLLSD